MVDSTSLDTVADGWYTAIVTHESKDGSEPVRKIERICIETGDRYPHKPLSHTAFHCFMLSLVIFPYLALYALFHGIRAPLVAVNIIRIAVQEVFSKFSWQAVGKCLVDCTWTATLALCEQVCTAVRGSFYALKMQLATLYGILDPLRGGVDVVKIEKEWRQKEHSQDIKNTPLNAKTVLQLFTERELPQTFFLASPLHPCGNVHDKDAPPIDPIVPLKGTLSSVITVKRVPPPSPPNQRKNRLPCT